MTKIGITRLAWILMGLLALSAVLMSVGQDDTFAAPAANSYLPTGASAFAALLRETGYRVVVSNSVSPQFEPGDVAIAFMVSDAPDRMAFSDDAEFMSRRPLIKETKDTILRFVKQGGGVLVLPIPAKSADFPDEIAPSPVKELPGEAKALLVTVRDSGATPPDLFDLSDSYESFDMGALTHGAPACRLSRVGQGYLLTDDDGIIATNRFIDHADNARLLLKEISVLAPPGSRVVFAEGTWGNATEPALMELIGPWALGAWRQILFLGLVVAFTLGKRFGIGVPSPGAQQGARELVDAVASIYTRSKATGLGLRVTVDRAEFAIRKRLKVGKEIGPKEFAALLPPDLSKALDEARRLSKFMTTPADALAAAQQLDTHLAAFLHAKA